MGHEIRPGPGSVVKIKDVAAAAGVSPATVSRVLNGSGAVSPERAAAVREATERLGYTPSGPARALRQQRTRVWAAVIPDIEDPFFTALVRGIEDVALEQDHRLVLCNTDDDLDKERSYLDMVLAERMAGVVIAVASPDESTLDALRARGVAVVAVDRLPEDAEGIDAVLVDEAAGARMATDHLVAQGATRVGCITGPPDTGTASDLQRGYHESLADAGLDAEPGLVRHGARDEAGGHAAVTELLGHGARPDGIVVTDNRMALGAMRALHDAGLEAPRDVRIVGFDDVPWTSAVRPELSVVARPAREAGRRAGELLASANVETGDRRVVLTPELIARASSDDGA